MLWLVERMRHGVVLFPRLKSAWPAPEGVLMCSGKILCLESSTSSSLPAWDYSPWGQGRLGAALLNWSWSTRTEQEHSLYPWVSKTVWDGDPAPPSALKCPALTQGTGLGRSSGKVSLGWCTAPSVILWSSNDCSKASQTLNQLKARFWHPSSLSPLGYAVSSPREGEWQMSGRSWEHPDTLNQCNDQRFCWFCLYEQFLFGDGFVWPRVTSWTLPLLLPQEINLWKSAEIVLLVSVAQGRCSTKKKSGKGFGSQEHLCSQGERDVTQALNPRAHRSWTLN